MADITTLLGSVRSGAAPGARELFELLYAELRSLAHAQCRRQEAGDLHTTALVHEAYLRFRAVDELRIEDRRHFLAYASHVMRSVVVDQARSRLAAKRGAGSRPLTLNSELIDATVAADQDLIRVHDALGELAALDARLAQVVEMKFFAGMTDGEIADVLQVSVRTVSRDWEKARLLLSSVLQP